MYCTFFVFLKCTIQGGPKEDVLLIAFLYLWLKFWDGIDKYWSWVYFAKVKNFKDEKETIAIAKTPGHRKNRKLDRSGKKIILLSPLLMR